jgi:aminoglycoside phosphotransferase (APT) family kinase protein
MSATPAADAVSDRARRGLRACLGAVQVGSISSLGGHSGLTLLASLEGGRRVVVKLSPPGRRAVGRHDVLRQARLLRMLGDVPGLRVPHVLGWDAEDPPMFVTEWVDGDATEPVLDGVPAGVGPDEIASRARAAARMMAALHSVAVRDLDLPGETSTTPLGELERWKQVMDAGLPELRPRAAELYVLLSRGAPPPVRTVVVHGDIRLGNMLCEGGAVRALIDWEIWSLSDPRVDLAWFLHFCDASNFPQAGRPAPGMPSTGALLAEYQDAVGAELAAMRWFLALGAYKMSVILGHNLRRHREGRRHDPWQETMAPAVLRLAERGLEMLA